MRRLVAALALVAALFAATPAHADHIDGRKWLAAPAVVAPATISNPSGCSSWVDWNSGRVYGSCPGRWSGWQMRVVASCSTGWYSMNSSWVWVSGIATTVAGGTCWGAVYNRHVEVR